LLKGRDIIIYLAVKYDGDWNAIYSAIKQKELVNQKEIDALLGQLKCQTVTIIDDNYPESLKKIYKPPFVLFYYGDLSFIDDEVRSLAVIGSRQPTNYGLTMGRTITSDLVKNRITIISGLAKGIDGLAHQVAIDEGGKTIAVLGSGIDRCYPKENLHLYQNIKQNHLLISEYPNHIAPNKDHFPWRNRIIAGLAQGVFVVEAKKQSGTLITVGYALYLGKDVYVLPHPANVDSSCNRLIKDGAILIESANDILEEMVGNHERAQVSEDINQFEKKLI
jgi:DNA processing protein